jgi:hypothetical protein
VDGVTGLRLYHAVLAALTLWACLAGAVAVWAAARSR